MTTPPSFDRILPTPREAILSDGSLNVTAGLRPEGAAPALAQRILGPGIVTGDPEASPLFAQIAPSSTARPGSYSLEIGSDGVNVIAPDESGLRHAFVTLAQVADVRSPLPCALLRDEPSFARRAVMLDISRCRIPTMQSLRALIDALERLKINHLQLYTEHTFAYTGHDEAWRDSSPITREEARELDSYCTERGIELCPNQNTLGHMTRWLQSPRYADLAETHGAWTFETDDGRSIERSGPWSLCPTDAGTTALLGDLLGELLPCFASGYANIGCDEAFDIGAGRSRREVEQRGALRVYLDHLHAVDTIVRAHAKRSLFWADMILRHPVEDWRDALPVDSIPLLWGYEHDSPFDEQARLMHQHGLEHWVCPGTSTWRSFLGRTADRRLNVTRAAEAGARHGASGLMITCWGDEGHRQTWPVDLLSIAHGAQGAWNADAAARFDAGRAAEVLFPGIDPRIGTLLEETGDADLELRRRLELRNTNSVFTELHRPIGPIDPRRDGSLEEWAGVRARVHELRDRFHEIPWEDELDSLRKEVDLTIWLAEHATDKAVATRAVETGDPGAVARIRLAADLGAISEEHRTLWTVRSRPGGLDESAAYYERVIDDYEKATHR